MVGTATAGRDRAAVFHWQRHHLRLPPSTRSPMALASRATTTRLRCCSRPTGGVHAQDWMPALLEIDPSRLQARGSGPIPARARITTGFALPSCARCRRSAGLDAPHPQSGSCSSPHASSRTRALAPMLNPNYVFALSLAPDSPELLSPHPRSGVCSSPHTSGRTRALAPPLNPNTRLPLPACTLAARTLAQCRAGLEVPFAPNRQRVSLPLVHHLGVPRARLGQ
jgi:hypothetical protein